MVIVPASATDEQIKEVIRQWLSLLADDRYEDALDMLYQDKPAPNWTVLENLGSRWTAELLRTVIRNYGLFEPLEGYEVEVYKVIPIQDHLRQRFEKRLRVDWIGPDGGWGLNPEEYAGIVHVDLPLDVDDDYDRPSDVTARFHIRRIDADRLALELYDAHVM